MNSNQLRRYTLEMALQDLQNWMRKYDSIAELAGIFDFIDANIHKIKSKKQSKKAA